MYVTWDDANKHIKIDDPLNIDTLLVIEIHFKVQQR